MTISPQSPEESSHGDQQDSTSKSRLPQPSPEAMEEYFQLQRNLIRTALALTLIAFLAVWSFYSLHIALNYLIGACTGVVYLRMLAKNVGELGRQRDRLGSGRLAVFVGLIVLATQWQQLEVIPVFLGFLTYKGALITYYLWTIVSTND